MFAIANAVFTEGNDAEPDEVFKLKRTARQELVLLGVLAPLLRATCAPIHHAQPFVPRAPQDCGNRIPEDRAHLDALCPHTVHTDPNRQITKPPKRAGTASPSHYQ